MFGLSKKLALFGPGLLYAGAAVGVSHLVQSTRAGAGFGFQLLWIIVLVNLIKYPIFQTGPRYAAATGTSLLDGYRKLGSWAVWVFVLMNLFTMFVIMAAISIVTAGLFSQFASIALDARFVAVGLLVVSMFILGFGQYTLLDKFMKWIVVTLTASTLVAVVVAFGNPSEKLAEFSTQFDFSNSDNLLFLVALIGWMPAPIDISIWHSLWSVSKMKEQREPIPLKVALQDFNVGYWGTTFLALGFLALGALVMYGTDQKLSSGSVEFASQLIGMYTTNIGQWAFPLIALAAFTTMFSTLLTCLDAFPRTLRRATTLIFPNTEHRKYHKNIYWIWIISTVIGTSVILLYFLSSMKEMVDLATTISFVIAPILATLNYLVMNDSQIPESFRQPKWLKISNLISIGLLLLFSLWFLLR